MANSIVSLFDNEKDAQGVVRELKGAGFSSVRTLAKDAGDTLQSLTAANVPEDAARFYEEGVRRGGTLVTLDVADNEIDRAMEIIERHNAVDINERSAQYRANGFTNFNMGEARQTKQGEAVLPVIEEELRVGKRTVERGGVRVYSRVTERPVEETVTLREEHVRVERRPADRAVTDADLSNARGGVVEVTETAEEAVVSKAARVVEEVVVGKETTQREETIRDTVRRTDVEVDDTRSDRTRAQGK